MLGAYPVGVPDETLMLGAYRVSVPEEALIVWVPTLWVSLTKPLSS